MTFIKLTKHALLASALIATPVAAATQDEVTDQANEVAATAEELQSQANELSTTAAGGTDIATEGGDDRTGEPRDRDDDGDSGRWGLLGLLGLAGLLGLRRRDHGHHHDHDRGTTAGMRGTGTDSRL